MDLVKAIQGLYPDLVFRRDYLVQDDGSGQYIKEWNNAYPLPTEEDLKRGYYLFLKKDKEREIRDASEEEVNRQTRRNEADIVVHKSSTGSTMNAAERDVRAIMQANHQKVVELINKIRSVQQSETAIAELEAIVWTPPTTAQVVTLSNTLEEAEKIIYASKTRRKHRTPPAAPAPPSKPPTNAPSDRLTALEERVADLEAELDARKMVFE